MTKEDFERFLRPFTPDINIVVEMPDGTVVDVFEVRYRTVDDYGTVVLVPLI